MLHEPCKCTMYSATCLCLYTGTSNMRILTIKFIVGHYNVSQCDNNNIIIMSCTESSMKFMVPFSRSQMPQLNPLRGKESTYAMSRMM